MSRNDSRHPGRSGGAPLLTEERHTPQELYRMLYGVQPEATPLACSGGDRVYTRLSSAGCPAVVGTSGKDLAENRTFVGLTDVFSRHGIRVPEILAVGGDCGSYLQSDLGDVTLLGLLSAEGRIAFSEKALSQLVKMQTIEEGEWLPVVYAPQFSRRMVMWDLNYFKYEFVKPCGVIFDEDRLEDDFECLAEYLSHYDPGLWGFMYRDFQSRNIMVRNGEPWFIDYQGGRRGPCVYDAVSFLWQAKAGFTNEERRRLLEYYASEFSCVRGVEAAGVLAWAVPMALLRTLQVLGAYGFRGLVERRSHFIESIPGALSNLGGLIEAGVLDGYPELMSVCRQLCESRFAGEPSDDGVLTVKVFSFSYKRGYPEDLSGNGGGFMFDCRGMHNPGRYDRYRQLTGLDKDVIDFLEERGEAGDFVDNAYRVVAPTVRRYLDRGFSSLQIGFGCTGGRHRSVFCARRLAERLAERFPAARIELVHRERGITDIFNDR